MDFSKFFIDRPIFAAVISVFFVLAGLAAMQFLASFFLGRRSVR
jgi:multidrug efflux pump subunit AcrB